MSSFYKGYYTMPTQDLWTAANATPEPNHTKQHTNDLADWAEYRLQVSCCCEECAATRRQVLDRLRAFEPLAALVKAVANMPENSRGTMQGDELNRAYTAAMSALDRCDENK